ncbi:MAG: hydroxyacid dehydrogenase [Bacteroidetes bacterium 4572_112]|nr:MAG: hydroxyacid dehydrogenase [Bacteroidetes bacterium 4572_112]
MEGIDSGYAATKNIILHNAPEGNRSAVGEQSVGMLLSLFNNLNKADAQVRQGIWQREANRGEEIQGKTIAIIGYGNMGSAFAEKISGFGARVIAYDKYKTGYANKFVEEVDLQTIFNEADVVSLHTPLQHDTKHMVNAEFLGSFSKKITLINTSRGPVVNTPDLVAALKKGKLKGVCLDVIEYEGMSFEAVANADDKVVFDYLKQAENVVLSPHIAGWTHQSNERMARVLAEKILKEV